MDVDDVATVVLVADVQQALDVLDLSERRDDVGGGVLPDMLDPRVELLADVVLDGLTP